MKCVYSSDGSKTYTLETGTAGADRLTLQDKMLSAKSHEHLEKAGISKGMIVFEVGCGNGVMTVHIAKAVGDTGQVYAIDISRAQLALAEERIKSEGLNNVIFVLADVNEENILPRGIADIVYSRFVLMHVQNPEKTIQKMKAYLKSGGVIASQESIMKTFQSSYQPKIFNDYMNATIALGKHYSVDYNIGQELEALYTKEGFNEVKVYYHQQNIPAEDAQKLILFGLAEKRKKMIEAKITSNEIFDTWEEAVKNIPIEDLSHSYHMAKQAYVLAWTN